jgi:hypothetical protein
MDMRFRWATLKQFASVPHKLLLNHSWKAVPCCHSVKAPAAEGVAIETSGAYQKNVIH